MENRVNHNLYDAPQKLNLTETLWYVPSEPIIFFTYDNRVEQLTCSFKDAVEELCESDVIELGDIYKDDKGNINFKIMRKEYLYYCRLSTEYNNIVINTIKKDASEFEKRKFIKSDRKAIKLGECGAACYVREGSTNFLVTEWGCETQSKGIYSPERMRQSCFDDLKEFILDDDSFHIEGTGFFATRILKTVKDYSNIEYDIEKEKALNDPGIVYVSRKSQKAQIDQNQKYVYEFICLPFEAEDYRAGSEVFVQVERDNGSEGIEYGNITLIDEYEDDLKRVVVSFKNQFNDRDLSESGGEIKKTANATQKRVREEVVNQFKRKQVRAQYMYKTFETFETEGFDESIDPTPVFKSMEERDAKSNPSQREAIKAGMQTKDIALVLGPPGTGKTTVIVEWVLHFIKEKKKVLISSKNNKAVDNVFERIAQFRQQDEYKNLGMIRIGNSDKVQANVREFLPENQHAQILSIITESTAKSSKKTTEDIETINSVKAQLQKITEHSKEFFIVKRKLSDKYSLLQELGMELVALKKIIDMLKSDRKKILTDINSKRIYLEETEKKGIVMKFLTSFITKRVKKQYEELLVQAEDTTVYKAKITEYNQKALLFKNEYESDELKKLKEEFLTVRERTFNEKMEIKASFYLPMGEISYTLNECEEELISVTEKVQDISEKLNRISDIISDWEDKVKDKDNNVLSEILIGNASIVGATCIGINSNRVFRNVDFDVAIIDEAGQIQIHDIIVPMSRAEKTLMLGDHKQIPPSVDEEMINRCNNAHIKTELLKKSFFEYLFEQRRFPAENKFMLDTQFRIPEEIADILSKKFYDGKYLSFEKKVGLPSLCPEIFKRPFVVIDTSDNPPSYRHEHTVDGKCYNKCEIDIVTKLLEKMKVGEGTPMVGLDEIGIITPYKRQAEMMRENVHKHFNLLSKTQVESMIATLDSFQGQERDMIIYSCTRSNEWNSIGFLSELRRINVAMSRCKKQLVIVGDFNFLTNCSSMMEDDFATEQQLESTDMDNIEESQEDENFIKEKQKMEFAYFMQDIVNAVKGGNGEYIMSKEFSNGRE